ncbi:MAG TPA: hypothetical protein VKV24_10255 [Casimicrobiaceae bacterium]|nr:hypothetical protein [Casimicrobiaceae bacterium]
MRTPVNIAGHPIHPMLETIPIGLRVFSFICDLFFVFGGGAPVVAARAVQNGARAHGDQPGDRCALHHQLLAAVGHADNPGGWVWLSLATILMVLVSGWLGGRMVYVLGIAVTPAPTPQDS